MLASFFFFFFFFGSAHARILSYKSSRELSQKIKSLLEIFFFGDNSSEHVFFLIQKLEMGWGFQILDGWLLFVVVLGGKKKLI